jgi:hypothetical protein
MRNQIFKGFAVIFSLIMIAFFVSSCFAGAPDPTSAVLAMAPPFSFHDMNWDDEPENMGGFQIGCYLALTRDIETYPALTANPVTDDEAVTMLGNYAMKPDKFFVYVYTTPDTLSLKPENQGEVDGKSFKLKGELFYPGTKTECMAFARKINNARGVLIAIDNDGERVIIGDKGHPVYFTPSLDWGKKAADRRGMTIAFESDSFCPGYKYNGTIPLDGSVVEAIS